MSMMTGVKNIFNRSYRIPSIDWPNRLDWSADELGELASNTEGEFLSIGERLQNFYLQARDLSEQSSSVASRIGGEDMILAGEKLHRIFNQIKNLDTKSSKGTDILGKILHEFEEMHHQIDGFAQIVRNLRVICSFIKIENARIGCEDSGFDTLSDDIGKLALNIESKSDNLIGQSSHLSSLVRKNFDYMHDFDSRQRDRGRMIFETTAKNLDSLQEERELSLKTLRDISTQWGQISRNIGEIVSSMQFHDITRQRIEHVGDNLKEATEELKREGRRKGRGRSLFSLIALFHRNGGSEHGDRFRYITKSVQTWKVGKAQLDHAKNEVLSAVERIMENLHQIACRVSEMSEKTRALAGTTDDSANSFLARLDDSFTILSTSVSEYVRINGELSQAVQQVAGAVGSLSDFMRDLQKIGVEMKMIALNACIHAAHIGSQGMGLDVLAEAITGLAVDTSRQTDLIIEKLKSILLSADGLSTDVVLKTAEDESGEEDVIRDLAEVAGRLRSVDEEIKPLLGHIHAAGQTLSEEVEQTIAGIGVHDQIREGITRVNEQMEDAVAKMQWMLPVVDHTGKREQLEDLTAKYTMEREREIHASVVMQADLPQPAMTAVGKGEQITQESEDRQKDKEDLGDNVELF